MTDIQILRNANAISSTLSREFFSMNAERQILVRSSLSIKRFWGKGERWKRKKERAEGEKPPPPSPISNLLSPSHLGRPDTQARSVPPFPLSRS